MPLQGPLFFINSILLGVGLAMDAFTVSLANGLAEPDMTKTLAGILFCGLSEIHSVDLARFAFVYRDQDDR